MEHKEKTKDLPWEVWANKHCRECKHELYLHILETSDKFQVVGACNAVVPGFRFCTCSEYLPPDNLDYIELLAQRKGIIKEE